MLRRARLVAGCLVFSAPATGACAGDVGSDSSSGTALQGVVLTAVTEPVPFTVSFPLSLVGSDRVCMVDSYEAQVVCGGRAWDSVQRFGGQGEGPGEYRSIVGIVPVSADRLGVVDFTARRLTIVDSSGAVVGTVRFDAAPMLVRAPSPASVAVTPLESDVWIPSQEDRRRRSRVDWVSPGEGIVATQMIALPDSVPVTRAPLFAGTWSPEHGFAFLRSPYEIVRFTTGGDYIGRYTPSHYEPELPNQRDLEYRAAGMRHVFGHTPSAGELGAYGAEPKDGMLAGAAVTFTEDGLLWIATTRDRDQSSFIDVYHGRGTRYLGSVRVRDRILGFDVRDGTLAVLVERKYLNAEGVRPYAIDWYDVSGWVAGHAP